MPTRISHLAQVDPRAELGNDVTIGPFCCVGPHVSLGEGCVLENNVTITGHTTIGRRNRFAPNVVIGGPPQDVSYFDTPTRLTIGDENLFREGVTVNRGAEKEDHTTRIGDRNMFMSNSHVAHNCHVHNSTILVNGVLLGGHVHVHNGAIISGNSVVHHYSTIGTLAFVSGGCRVPHDIPPYMLASGNDDPTIVTINLVGLRRAGIPAESIRLIKHAHRLLYRERKKVEAIREVFEDELGGALPEELITLLDFVEAQHRGKLGRAREASRHTPAPAQQHEEQQRRAA